MATEAEVRAAIAVAERVLAGGAYAPYPAELFPEVGRRNRSQGAVLAGTPEHRTPEAAPHARPVAVAAEVDVTLEAVGAWSAELGFVTTARAGRVTRAND